MFKDKLDRESKAWLILVVYAAALKDDCEPASQAFNALMEELGL